MTDSSDHSFKGSHLFQPTRLAAVQLAGAAARETALGRGGDVHLRYRVDGEHTSKDQTAMVQQIIIWRLTLHAVHKFVQCKTYLNPFFFLLQIVYKIRFLICLCILDLSMNAVQYSIHGHSNTGLNSLEHVHKFQGLVFWETPPRSCM